MKFQLLMCVTLNLTKLKKLRQVRLSSKMSILNIHQGQLKYLIVSIWKFLLLTKSRLLVIQAVENQRLLTFCLDSITNNQEKFLLTAIQSKIMMSTISVSKWVLFSKSHYYSTEQSKRIFSMVILMLTMLRSEKPVKWRTL